MRLEVRRQMAVILCKPVERTVQVDSLSIHDGDDEDYDSVWMLCSMLYEYTSYNQSAGCESYQS